MNNIEQIYNENKNAEGFVKGYINYLAELLKKIDITPIADFFKELESARDENKTVFIAGNGGSAATASHMTNDIAVDVYKKTGITKPFRIMSLTDNIPVMLAIANDTSYDRLFVNQLEIYYQPGDRFVAISASGNSPNVVEAAKWVKERNGKVVGIVGFDGGKLKDISDLLIHINTQKGEYGPVEDIHMIIDHLASNWLIQKMNDK